MPLNVERTKFICFFPVANNNGNIDDNITMLILIATALNDKCISNDIYNICLCKCKHIFLQPEATLATV